VQLGVVEPERVAQTHRDDTCPHRVFDRLPHAQIGRDGEGGHDVGKADGSEIGHRAGIMDVGGGVRKPLSSRGAKPRDLGQAWEISPLRLSDPSLRSG
jgi:hypothetical protein